MTKTSIEWTEFSVNPIRARLNGNTGHYCEKVSPGCKNCYASRLQPRFRMPVFQEQRSEKPDLFLDTKALEQVLRRKKPTTWFWCDMTDMFGEWVPNEWIAACFGVMAATPWHTHQVLSKRAERLPQWFAWARGHFTEQQRGIVSAPNTSRAMLDAASEHLGKHPALQHAWEAFAETDPWPLQNVHLGVSVEDQPTADERIRQLLQVQAAVHFISAEPLLGEVDLSGWLRRMVVGAGEELTDRMVEQGWSHHGGQGDRPGLGWVIVGGESGPGARECEVSWIRRIVSDCSEAGVPVFVKQLGAHARDQDHFGAATRALRHKKGGDPSEWPEDLRVRQFPGGSP